MKIKEQLCFTLESIQEGSHQHDLMKKIAAQVGKDIFWAIEIKWLCKDIAVKFSVFCSYFL